MKRPARRPAPDLENIVKNDILNYCRALRLPVARIQCGQWRTDRGHWIRGADAGTSDIVVQLPGRPAPILWVETKREGETTSDDQDRFIERAEELGALVVVAYELDDFLSIAEPYLRRAGLIA